MRIWLPALALFCLLLLTTGGSLGARESVSEETGNIVVFNMYYANPGMADDVLETRLYASVVRDRLGLPRGRVLRRINDAEELPEVVWECEFADIAAHDLDMDARADSDAFEGVRERMRTPIRRFERTLWQVKDPLSPVTLTKAGLPSTAQPPGGIVVTNWYYANADQRGAVLSHRIHASEVREQLKYPGGRVLDRVVDPVWRASGSHMANGLSKRRGPPQRRRGYRRNDGIQKSDGPNEDAGSRFRSRRMGGSSAARPRRRATNAVADN